MITLQSADNILKTVYLSAITDLLNTKVNPLLAKIEKTSVDIAGKDIRRAIKLSIDGGIGAGDETSDLPKASPAKYAQAVVSLKNLYGQIEISDKAMRAGTYEKGAFTNLLNSSLEGLLDASRYNLGRMLYGDGSAKLGKIIQGGLTAGVFEALYNVGDILLEGMVVDLHKSADDQLIASGVVVEAIDRKTSGVEIYFDQPIVESSEITVYACGSRDKEITGLEAIFDTTKPLYGLDRNKYKVLTPYIDNDFNSVTDIVFQKAIDKIEGYSSSVADYIACSNDVKLAYQAYLSSYKMNVDIMTLAGGYKTLSYNGIPVVGERFIPNGTAYVLDSRSFKMHQLCDWQFIEGDSGRVLRQMQGKPTYTATLVKYCDIICDRPNGQAKLLLDSSI